MSLIQPRAAVFVYFRTGSSQIAKVGLELVTLHQLLIYSE